MSSITASRGNGLDAQYVLCEITQEIARRLLDQNGAIQRPERSVQVRFFAEALRQNRFQTTHQGIAVTGSSLDEPGSLIDGQHRLRAIAETGIAAFMWVAFNSREETFNAVDVGAGRNVSDLLSIRGYKNAKNLIGAWQYAWCWEGGRVAFSTTKRDDLIAQTLERHPSLLSMEVIKKPELLQQAPLTFIGYIVNDDAFMDDLLECREGTCGGAVGIAYAQRKKRKMVMDRRYSVAIAVKARNDLEAGLMAPPKGYTLRTKDAFPTPAWAAPIPFDSIGDADDGEE